MNLFSLGDHINVKDLNAITYLLRKFKRINTGLRLGSLTLTSDYGSFVFDKPLTSVGSNFIIEQDINVSSTNCFKNCFYSFVFSVIDVNTSGTVNKRTVKVTGNTGENGTLLITLPTDLIDSNEVILPNFKLDIVFDEHEYYTPVVDAVKVDLVSDKNYVLEDEIATITATLTDHDDDPLTSVPCTFIVNGEAYLATTDENGQAEYTYTGTGEYTKIEIKVITTTLTIYDTPLTANIRGNYMRFIGGGTNSWLSTEGECEIDWGDGTTSTVNNPTSTLIHNYTDSEQTHTIAFLGVITGLGDLVFANSGLMSINIPSTITSFGKYCFNNCDLLESIIIPNSVTSIGDNCFKGCYYLVDYQLYWIGDAIIPYDNDKIPNNEDTVFTIPNGQTSNYVARGYPSAKLSERSGIITILTLQSEKSSYYTDESVTLTGLLIDEDNNPLTSTSVKIYQNNALLDTVTTDSNGEFTKTLTGLNVGAYTFKVQYDGDTTYDESTSNTCSINIQNHTYSLSIASDKQTITDTESITISGTLLKDGSAFTSQSVDLYDGVTKIDTLTTDAGGNYSTTLSGLSVGTHVFQAVNENATSATVTISVEHVYIYNLSITANKQTMYTDENVIISGYLLRDGEGLGGQEVKIYDGSTLKGSSYTGSNGLHRLTVSGLSAGVHTFKAVNNNVESSTVSVTVKEHDYSLSVASTKDILSYSDGESATLTASLTDDGVAVAGETLSYTVKHDNTTIDTGTDTTDANGEISFTYASTGIGDIDIEVSFGILLQETYAITDNFLYRPTEKQIPASTTGSGNHISVYDDNLSLSLPNKFELSWKIKTNFNSVRFGIVPVANKTLVDPNYSLLGQQSTNDYVGLYRDTSVHAVGTNLSTTGTQYCEWKIIRDGNTFQWYFNGAQINSDVTLTWFDTNTPHTLALQYWNTGNVFVKDIVIKAL